MLQGYKTYIAGSLTIIFALLGLLTGNLDGANVGQLIVTAILGMTVHSAIVNK